MKLGPLEGTEEEVSNLFQNNGLNLFDYLEKPEAPLKRRWMLIPCALFVLCFGALTLASPLSAGAKNFLFLAGFASCIWAAISVHIRFKSTWGAAALVLAGLLIMLVALGVVSPAELPKYYESVKPDV